MPLKRYAYSNEAFDKSNKFFKYISKFINKTEVDTWRAKSKAGHSLLYKSYLVKETLEKFSKKIYKKNFMVMGINQQPWLEALALEFNAVNITTIDYANRTYEQDDLKSYQLNDYLDYILKTGHLEIFENAASYSMLEHIGLGRYGDALNPNGDIQMLKQIHCLLKPGGLLFLGVYTSKDLKEGFLEFNFHRVYGEKRLGVLFGDDWDVLFNQREEHNLHSFFVLQKKIEISC